jgi:acyl-coenzyme A synthetase/AMP-(fatty) acid ligase/3-hydroxymyristoyl/3-hydroxydecanoyl-(acyl carrier protein) dehydratase
MPERSDMLSALAKKSLRCHRVGWRLGKSVGSPEFLARVQVWQAVLKRASGRAFALYISDSLEFAAALFGAWHAGKTIYLPADKLPSTCAGLGGSVDGFVGEFEPEWEPLTPMPEDASVRAERFDRLRPDFVGLVIYTSGTTGVAQAIPKKLSQLSAEVATLESQFGHLLGTAEIVATVSHQHIYGLLFNVLWPLTAERVIHAQNFSFPGKIEAATAKRDYALVSSPAHLKRLPLALLMGAHQPRAVFSSGGPLPFEVAQETARLLGILPIEIYGSSETGGIAWRQPAAADEKWTPFPGVEWRIDQDESVLEVRSPNLPDNEWFRMADGAVSVGDHHFLLRGRTDQIVKIEEKRISLSAIEQQLKAAPMVSDARAIVVEGRRQRIAAFIVPSHEGRKKLAETGKLAFNRRLRAGLAGAVDPVGLPRVWHYLDALPVNAQGKTTYAALRALLDGGTARPRRPLGRLIMKDAERAVFELTVPRDLLYFDGHFASVPILPGVVQVDWVILYGRQCFDLPPVFRGLHALKFHRVIPPESPFTLELVHEPAKSCLSFNITSPAGHHASGRVLFGENGV